MRRLFYLVIIVILVLLFASASCITITRPSSGSSQGSSAPEKTSPQSSMASGLTDIKAQIEADKQKENQYLSVIKASGLPVISVYLIDVSYKDKALVVVMNYEKMIGAISPGYFVAAGIKALSQIALLKTLDLTGITYVTVTLNDAKERTISEAGVRAADMLSYRSAKITQQQFIKLTASKVEDRFAAFDAMTKGAKESK